jgi:hypothetical protein
MNIFWIGFGIGVLVMAGVFVISLCVLIAKELG